MHSELSEQRLPPIQYLYTLLHFLLPSCNLTDAKKSLYGNNNLIGN